jgi:hypothetical protein
MSATTGDGSWNKGRGYNAADLEREGNRYRANMDETLNEIEQELSPSKLLDRSVQYFRDHGGEFMREAGATVRSNPLPVLLTAAGVVWLTAAVASSRSNSQSQGRWSQGGHLDEDMDSFDEFADGQGYAGTSSSSSSSSGRIQSALSRGESQLEQLVREQPIALGAVALAAGALLGAALPITDYENRMMSSVGNDNSAGNSEAMTDE